MLGQLNVVWVVAKRTGLSVLRRPVLLVFSLGQPLIWMLFFGFLFERYRLTELPKATPYLDFIAPGIAVMTVMFGASQSGIGWIRDLQIGFLPRMLATPARPTAILLGKILADAVRFLVQAGVVLGLALWLGIHPNTSLLALLQAAVCLLLFGSAFAALSCAIAFRAQAQEAMASFVHLVNMPLFFTSSALVPIRQMPDWLATVSRFNPLTATVEALRGALLFAESPSLSAMVALAGLSLLLLLLARSQMSHVVRRY